MKAGASWCSASRRYAATGSLLPFSSSGSTGSASTASRTSCARRWRRAGPRRRRAACSSRAATLTASPVASRSAVPDDHLAGVDADPRLDAELRQRVAHLDGGPHGAERVVLVHLRHAEDRHHGVADELLDGAAVPLDDRLHLVEVAREDRAQRLGVESTRRAPSSRRRRRRGASRPCGTRAAAGSGAARSAPHELQNRDPDGFS